MNNRNHAAEQLVMQETRELRAQASDLLNQLLDHREQSEARFAEVGSSDPIKSVTGKSAIDKAIEATRNLIRQLDAMADASPLVDVNSLPRNKTTAAVA